MMMTRALTKAKLGQRSIIHMRDSNYFLPESLEDMADHVSKTKPEYMLTYFHADWNPICAEIEDDVRKTFEKYGNFKCYKIDTDKHPRIKFFYDARVEPCWLIQLNGAELERIVGFNFEHIHHKLDETIRLHRQGFDYFGDGGNFWEKYTDILDVNRRDLEQDRDNMKIYPDYENL